jgi:tRNA threonylcarbamoyl adenosine modification protein (Sua5/YciO/YrdC/YwlC family)
MVQYFNIHPTHPQNRLLIQAATAIDAGAVAVYPTDSCYAIGCHIGDKQAMDRIRAIRRVDARHHFTLVCRDLSEIASYARVDNASYRLLKSLTPGPYTFLLRATGGVPRRLQNPRRKTIGIRVPDNVIAQALLHCLDQPLMSSTLILPDAGAPLADPEEIREQMSAHVDLIIDGGHCGYEPTSVINMAGDVPEVVRHGKGDVGFLEGE